MSPKNMTMFKQKRFSKSPQKPRKKNELELDGVKTGQQVQMANFSFSANTKLPMILQKFEEMTNEFNSKLKEKQGKVLIGADMNSENIKIVYPPRLISQSTKQKNQLTNQVTTSRSQSRTQSPKQSTPDLVNLIQIEAQNLQP